MTDRSPSRRRVRRRQLMRLPLAVLGVLALGAAGLALAAAKQPRLHSAHNAQLGRTIVVDSAGRVVYALKPETTQHLLCRTTACFQVWPPVTVRSSKTRLKAGSGVKGHLGLLRRSKGVLQVTIGGLPLYRFAPDHGRAGAADGQGIHSFGGTWHVIGAKAAKSNSGSVTTSTTTTPAYTPTGY